MFRRSSGLLFRGAVAWASRTRGAAAPSSSASSSLVAAATRLGAPLCAARSPSWISRRGMADDAAAGGPGTAEKLTLHFATPEKVIAAPRDGNAEVDMVVIPASTGDMGIMPNHVPTVAELKPGVVSVHRGDDVTRYVVPGGFCIMHGDSTCGVTVPEAMLLDALDAASVAKGVDEYQAKYDSATEEKDKAFAQIGLEMHTAMKNALDQFKA